MFGPRARPNSQGLEVTLRVRCFWDTGFPWLCDPCLLLSLMVTVNVVLRSCCGIDLRRRGWRVVPPIRLLVCARGAHTCSQIAVPRVINKSDSHQGAKGKQGLGWLPSRPLPERVNCPPV